MYTKIADIPAAEQWRVFSSDLDSFPSVITEEDYLKIGDLINKILKGLFKISYQFFDHTDFEQFGYDKAVSDAHNSQQKKKKLSFVVNSTSKLDKFKYTIDFVFILAQVENLYVFEKCGFLVQDKYLLDKLPMGSNNQNRADCYTYFSANQKYDKTYVNYKHCILNSRIESLSLFGQPYLNYEYCVHKNTLSFQLQFSYKPFDYLKQSSGYVDKKFAIDFSKIDDKNLLRSKQLHHFFNLFTKNIDLSDYFNIEKYDVHDEVKLKAIIENFFEDPFMGDKLLLLDMMHV